MAQYPQRIGEPDCRDYLRTGRCKYGESCKYHHPPNVQSGGGIKTPLNPSEPPFPIRPGEPPCQYYLKHGTCKFGQTCKFHHPPNIIATSGTGSLPGTFLVNVGGMNILTKPTMQRGGGQPILLNANGAEVAEHSQQGTMLQILPQRPNEPDCIYFLRNGRCKYGATCKYHHPMNTSTVQQVESTGVGRKPQTVQLHLQPQSRTGRGRAYSTGSVSEVNNIRSLQLIQQTPTGHGHHGQQTQSQNYVGNSGVGPTHILVADGPISVMTVDQVGSTAPAYQQINSMGNQLYSQPEDSTGSDVGDSRHEHSPQMTSSVASSYETAVSSYEFMAQGNRNQQVSAEAGSAHWPRTNSQQHLPSMGTPQRQGTDTLRTSTSGGSLHSYQSADTMSGAQAHGHYGSMRGNRAQIARSSGSIAGDGMHQHQPSSLRLAVDAANRSNQQQEQERRLRAVSVGSTGEGSLMYSSVNEVNMNVRQESIARGWPSSASLPTSTINIATDRTQTLWEEQNMDHAAGYSNDSPYPDASENASAMNRDQGSKQHSQYRQNEAALHRQDKNSHLEDDGLSMMTSALLNMLDTPDEDGSGRQTNRGTALSNNFSSASVSSHVGVSASRQRMSLSAPNTPIINSSRRPRAVSAVDEFVLSGGNNGDHPPQHRAPSHFPRTFQNDVNSSQGVEMDFTGNSLPSHHHAHSFDSRYYLDTPDNYRSASPPEHTSAAPSRWSPTLCDPEPSSHQLERNAQSVSALQQPPGTTPSASQGTPNIGLFLS